MHGPVAKLPEIPKRRHRYSYSGALNLQFLRETKEKAQQRRTALPNVNLPPNSNNKPCLAVKFAKSRPKPTVEAPPPQVANAHLYPPHAHGQKPLKKFKAMARMVKNQLAWTKEMAQCAEEHMKTHVIQSHTDEQAAEALTFNVNAFRPEVQSCGGLSTRAKAILIKPSWTRSDEDLKFLHQFTLKLKCFDRYPVYVRKELARVLYYEAFEAGRVVIRQGDLGFNFYFIVSGNVLVEVQEEDQMTGKKHNTIVGDLGSGSAFGELALLHDARRRATIVCKENTEFLKVDKPDFDMVLRKNHEREWNARMAHFEDHPIFVGWSAANLNFAVEGSHILEYPPNTVILKDLSAPSEKIYFIIHGVCKVVQKVDLLEHHDSSKTGRKKLVLPPINAKQGCSASRNDAKRVQKWWTLRGLQPGDYFGVGEGQEGMSVISDHRVKCLLVNKMVFMKHERGRCLSRMQAEAARLYPSRTTALKSYMEVRKWKEYKLNLVNETVKNQRRPHTTTLADVPRVLQ